MRLIILDVGAGSCATLVWEDGGAWVFDCGKAANEDLGMRLWALGVLWIERLFVQNEDEDHLRGFPDLRNSGLVGGYTFTYRNRALNVDEVGREKRRTSGRISPAWDAWQQYVNTLTPVSREWTDRLNDSRFKVYKGQPITSADTNNASLVVVLEVGQTRIVLPGDMEKRGWEFLAKREPSMLNDIKKCEAFVASHHGRENGYHEKIMKLASPRLVVISDKALVHETQEGMTARYRKHAEGRTVDGETRYVLTTRKDGDVHAIWRRPTEAPRWMTRKGGA